MQITQKMAYYAAKTTLIYSKCCLNVSKVLEQRLNTAWGVKQL